MIWRYDIFLSFKGSDARYNFIVNLEYAWSNYKVFTIEEELEKDDEIAVSSLNAIEESRVLVVVFSPNYASSTRCLEELVKILDCNKRNNQPVFPIFLGVDPSDVKNQTGNFGRRIYMTAHKHSSNNRNELVEKWCSALRHVAHLPGHHFKFGGDTSESDFTASIQTSVADYLPCLDVFISQSEKDSHISFTNFLYKALQMKRFRTGEKPEGWKDDGDQSLLVSDIERSRLSIIVLSENYLNSSSCLQELVTILNCMNTNRQLVWVVFNKVDPSYIRHQGYSFEKIMIGLEYKFGNDKVQKWKSALFEAATLKAWHVKIGDEYEIIEEIVEMAIDAL